MKEELNIEVDENDKIIGLRPISEFQTGKFIHRSAHLLLENSKGEILIQKRSSNKKWYPNLYTYSVSGTVANESYEKCIKREMKEEIGVSTPAKLLFIYKYFDKQEKAFHALFYGKSDDKITLDKEEIAEIKWISKDNLNKDLLKNPDNYTPHVLYGLKKYLKNY
ncbi:MAG: NUDIX domain-containing protein [Nanoarchaeota archaeon]